MLEKMWTIRDFRLLPPPHHFSRSFSADPTLRHSERERALHASNQAPRSSSAHRRARPNFEFGQEMPPVTTFWQERCFPL